MKKHIKSDTFSDSELLTLLRSVQNGDLAAEGRLASALPPLVRVVALNWKNTKLYRLEDRIQECCMHVLEALRNGPADIGRPKEFIRAVSKNCLINMHEREGAKKRVPPKINEVDLPPERAFMDRGGYEASLDAQTERARGEGLQDPPEGESAWGQTEARPDEAIILKTASSIDEIVQQFMVRLPNDLRGGIEKSLDLVADLFRTRSKLRGNLRRDSRCFHLALKAIQSIAEARELVGKLRGHNPNDNAILRLRELQGMPDYAYGGRSEEDRKEHARQQEESELKAKYGTSLSLYEAQLDLSAEALDPKLTLLLTPAPALPDPYIAASGIWIDHIAEIAGMRASPLNIVYQAWSRAPGFRLPGSGKYKNRRAIEFAIYAYKRSTRGTDREFIFSSIKEDSISSVDELEKNFDRFRKAGYGQALQEKYRPIIDLIYRKSFPQN